ncbi:Auxin-responsive GH3 family protein [Hibiscus syriacus]|uniref:Auxin-responsive GH3 family protein n=1 Tax=Hibiscus syriacus TaxID=106335 RepID=A0A6A3AXS7_HIBSY|nr:Auxin-responsive GH3 family protein [Hibiscus syriacus]
MIKVEHMGVSPSQAKGKEGNHVIHEESTTQESHEIGSEYLLTGLSENKDQCDRAMTQNESAEITNGVSCSSIDKPSSEYVARGSSPEHLGLLSRGGNEHNQTQNFCPQEIVPRKTLEHKHQHGSEIVQIEESCPTKQSIPFSKGLFENSITDSLGLSPENAGKDTQSNKLSSPQQGSAETTVDSESGNICKELSESPEQGQQLDFESLPTSIEEGSTDVFNQSSQSNPEDTNKSNHRNHLQLPSEEANNVIQTSKSSPIDEETSNAIQTSKIPLVDKEGNNVIQTGKSSLVDEEANNVIQSSKNSPVDEEAGNVIQTGKSSLVDEKANNVIQTSKSSPVDEAANNVIQTSKSSVDEEANYIIQTSKSSLVDEEANNVIQISKNSLVDEEANNVIHTSKSSLVDEAANNVIQTSKSSPVDEEANNIIQTSKSSLDEEANNVIQTSKSSLVDEEANNVIQTSKSSHVDEESQNVFQINKSSFVDPLELPQEFALGDPSIQQLGLNCEDMAEISGAEQHKTSYNFDQSKDGQMSKMIKKESILRSLTSNDNVLALNSQEKFKPSELNNNLADVGSNGWKGLSLEKLKPEKEIQRATSEILRRKLKIRDLFQHIDSLCGEGKLPESLFDSEGQIDSEDIFCAKCGSKDLSPDNDIILCDGVCDRGFHQYCLQPPLLKEDIPPDDEGWLCPGCNCKVDCIQLLNESQGTSFSLTDNWEVFPEATLSTDGENLDPIFGLPSDDSDDDDDYNLDDNDYNPDDSETDKKDWREGSSSDESDFTSPSEELKVQAYDISSQKDEEDPMSLNDELLSIMELASGEDDAIVSKKRNNERLDYKRLYDETYGDAPSSCSDDEDWIHDAAAPRKKLKRTAEAASASSNGNASEKGVATLSGSGGKKPSSST